jgi:hypothetical protein
MISHAPRDPGLSEISGPLSIHKCFNVQAPSTRNPNQNTLQVLTELEREVIEAWMENSWAYQEDFRLDAPPDFTVWQRQPDGTFVAAVH